MPGLKFPYYFISELPQRARDEIYRDLLEIERFGAREFPWVVVADDGTGDYRTIKAAVEAVEVGNSPPSTNELGPAVIVVKPSSAGYTDTAKIALPAETNIVVIASVAYEQNAVNETPNTASSAGARYQSWTMPGFTSAGLSSSITLIGFDVYSGTSQVIPDMLGGFITLNSQNCRWMGTGYMFGSMSHAGETLMSFTDCYVNPTVLRSIYGTTYMNATRTRFTNFAPGSATPASVQGVADLANVTPYWNFDSCQIGGIGTLLLGTGDDDYDYQQIRFVNCQISGTSLEMGLNSSILIEGCTSADLTSLKLSGSYGNDNLRQNVQLVNNIMPNTHVQVAIYNGLEESCGHISGIYNRLTLGGPAAGGFTAHQASYVCNVLLKATANSQTLLTIGSTGKYNLVVAQLSGQGFSTVTGVNVAGSFNRVIYTAEGLGTEVTDSGTSNWANGGIEKSIVDAKGDLIVASAADTLARLAVGTNDYVLTADSAQTLGMKWAVLPSGLTAGGNLLTQNQASVETDTTGFAVDAGCTIARSTAQAAHGLGSLALTRT